MELHLGWPLALVLGATIASAVLALGVGAGLALAWLF